MIRVFVFLYFFFFYFIYLCCYFIYFFFYAYFFLFYWLEMAGSEGGKFSLKDYLSRGIAHDGDSPITQLKPKK